MQWERAQKLEAHAFQRYCGVKPETFARMLAALRQSEQARLSPSHGRGHRPPKLSLENQLLLALCYWREYRSFFHLGLDWGLSEAQTTRVVHLVEDALSAHLDFQLPGKAALRAGHADAAGSQPLGAVILDATQVSVERPKKSSVPTTRARRSVTRARPS